MTVMQLCSKEKRDSLVMELKVFRFHQMFKVYL